MSIDCFVLMLVSEGLMFLFLGSSKEDTKSRIFIEEMFPEFLLPRF